jgi:putative endonuclease
MPHYVYILHSETTQRYYCGQTDNVHSRLGRHNGCKVKSTKHGTPWTLVKFFEVDARSEAMQLEARIKGRGIKRWLLEDK